MDFRQIYDSVYDEVESRCGSHGGCHDFDHTLRVVQNSMQLCKKLPAANRQTVLLAALLHDIARAEEDASKGAVDHAERGAAMVPEILQPYELPPEQISHIAEAVRTHRYRGGDRPATLEAEIVYDADKLDSLGAVGIGRAFLFAGKAGARLHNDARTALASEPYSVEDTAYREYLVKLRKLPNAMLTHPARILARKRAAIMKRFFITLDKETDNRKESNMKVECPYCWQHYEIDKSDMDRELVCINCEQAFRVQDALVIDAPRPRHNALLWVTGGFGAAIVLLLALNLWSWQQMIRNSNTEVTVAEQSFQPVEQSKDLQAAIAPLNNSLKEVRAENEKLAKQAAALQQLCRDLTARVEKAEKEMTANHNDEQAESTADSINTLRIKIETAHSQIKLLDEYHKQLLKGLTGLRTELNAMNIADRLANLEKKAEEYDPSQINHRIDKLEAQRAAR